MFFSTRWKLRVGNKLERRLTNKKCQQTSNLQAWLERASVQRADGIPYTLGFVLTHLISPTPIINQGFKNHFCFTYSPHQIVLSVPCLLYTPVKYSTAASFISTTLQKYYWAVIVFDVYVDDVPTAYTWVLLDAVMKTVWWKLLLACLYDYWTNQFLVSPS